LWFNCEKITSITSLNPIPPKVGETGMFTPSKSGTLYVPQNNIATYRAASEWSRFENIVASPTTLSTTTTTQTNSSQTTPAASTTTSVSAWGQKFEFKQEENEFDYAEGIVTVDLSKKEIICSCIGSFSNVHGTFKITDYFITDNFTIVFKINPIEGYKFEAIAVNTSASVFSVRNGKADTPLIMESYYDEIEKTNKINYVKLLMNVASTNGMKSFYSDPNVPQDLKNILKDILKDKGQLEWFLRQ